MAALPASRGSPWLSWRGQQHGGPCRAQGPPLPKGAGSALFMRVAPWTSVPRPSDTRTRGRSQRRIPPAPQAALLTPRLPRDHGPCPPADSDSAQSGPPAGRPAGASWQSGAQEPLPRAHLPAPCQRPGLLWPSRLHIGRRCRSSQDPPPGAGGCRAARAEPGRWVQPDPLAISSSPWVLNQSSSFSRSVLSI